MPTKQFFLIGAFAVTAGFAITGCTIDNGKLEKSIKDSLVLGGEKVPTKSVSCPAGKPLKAGTEFDCKATLENGDAFTVKVSVKDGGKVDLKTVEILASTKQLGDQLNKANAGAKFDCGTKWMVAAKDAKVECKNGDAPVTLAFNDKGEAVPQGGGEVKPVEPEEEKAIEAPSEE